jgi:hypothetical protein
MGSIRDMIWRERHTENARFMAATYLSDIHCSYLPGFARPTRDRIAEQARSATDLVNILHDAESAAGTGRLLGSAQEARQHVEAADLRTIRDILTCNQLDRVDVSPDKIYADVVLACKRAVEILDQHDLPFGEPPEVFAVEELPPPFDQKPITALAVDSADEEEYGISQGIYFRSGELTPYYSSFIALHEMLHVLLGRKDPERTAHGLEEGLSDLLGSIWLSHLILGRDLTRRLYVLNRLSSQYYRYWERYLDSARQALSLVLVHGLDGLLRLLRNGRKQLYKIEETVLSPVAQKANIDLNDDFISLAWELLITYPRAFVCSPAAFLFAKHARSGMTVREVATQALLSPELATLAARELRDEHGVIFLRRDELVVIEATPAAILAKSWFRYDSQ